MAQLLDDLASRWRANPDAKATMAICDALCGAPRGPLVEEVGQVATRRYATDADVMRAAAQMYLAAQRLADAQAALVLAGKAAPRDPTVYRSLGEVLLRRGDADRAGKVLERALQLGGRDAETRAWIERAKSLRAIQASSGMQAVAAEVARAAPIPPIPSARPPMESIPDNSTTEVRVVLAPALGKADDPTPPLMPRRPVTPHQSTPLSGLETQRSPSYPLRAAAKITPVSAASSDDVTSRFERFDRYDKDAETLPPMPKPWLGDSDDGRAAARGNGPLPAAGRPPTPHDEDMGGDRLLGGAPAALDARDVLDALARAGIFEPQAASATAPMRWDAAEKPKRGRASMLLVVAMVVFAAASAGILMLVRDRRAKEHEQAEALLVQIEQTLHGGVASDLAAAESKLGHAFDLDSRSSRAAIAWLRERALLGLLKGGSEIAFEDSIARAKEVGVKESDVAFAHVASFLFQADTVGAAALLPKWDGAAANDPWYQLLAGATLERAGDARAIERYEAAAKLDPELVVAQISRVRALAIDGDPAKAMDAAKQLETKLRGRAEPAALVSLAWARDATRDEQAPPEVDEAIKRASELPVSLAVVPHALVAIRAIDKHMQAEAKEEIQRGLTVVGGPGVASWLGAIALDAGDEQLARKAALAAVSFSAVYPPARVLAARVALMGDRLDEALKATEELDANSPDVAVVRAATAYERVDPDALARALEAVPFESRKLPFLTALTLAPDALNGVGSAKLSPEKIVAMADDDAPWSDLVAMDIALDVGELETASQIAAAWKGDERPLRAIRLARLARYQGKLEVADALSQRALAGGTVTPRVLTERVLTLVARGRPTEAGPLLAKYPLVLGAVSTWLSAFVTASNGKVDDARGHTAPFDPPPALAPLPSRLIAAVALGAMKDKKRGVDVVKALATAGVLNPDIANAAMALGFHKVDRGKRFTLVAP